MAVEAKSFSPQGAAGRAKPPQANMVRARLLVFFMLAAAFGLEYLSRFVVEQDILRQLLSLTALLTICAPALFLILRLEDTPFLKWTITLAASSLILSQILRIERELHYLWPAASPADMHPWHPQVQWALLLLGFVLMLATLHAALIETVFAKRRLLFEQEGLLSEVSRRQSAEQALQARVRQQSLLSALNREGLASVRAPDFLNHAAQTVVDALGVSHSEIYEYEASAERLERRAGVGWKEQAGGPEALPAPLEPPHALQVLHSQQPVHLAPSVTDGLCALRGQGITSGVGVLIGRQEQPLGVLCAHATCGHAFSTEDVTFLEAVASTIAATIERLRAEAAVLRNERYFRALIDSAHDVITVLNADGTIRFESPSIQTQLGYTVEERIGANAFNYLHEEDLPRAMETFQAAIGDPESTPTVTLRLRHQDGSWRRIEVTGRNLLNDPHIAGVVVLSRDVTEREELEQQLLHAQKLESVGRLAGGVAHDFNNLLTAILGYTELSLMEVRGEGRLHGHLEQIRAASHRAADLTRQLLAFARKQLVEPRVMDMNAIISGLEKMLDRLIGEDVELRTALNGVGRVFVDPGQFEQVVTNLVINARDAMQGGGRILIETRDVFLDQEYARQHREVTPGQYVMLAVSDTGVGMAEEVRERVFEPFFTTKESGKGTGLGLATCYGIVRQAEGHIWVYSEPGHGATFRIYLPRTDARPEERDSRAPRVVIGGTETILLVEDEPLVREITTEMLKSQGYTVFPAGSGRQALEIAAEKDGAIDLLLTDVVMPDMGGRAVAEQLTAAQSDLRVLYMSGYTDDAIVHHGVLDPGVEFLSKPFTPAALSRALRKIFDAKA